ncbi:MAG TPA: DUF6056 family protein [Kofleriaceae bacterium]|nr:DUF6056 family protein [Kofleriaceae bacterium]
MAGAVVALWLLFFIQALWSPVLLDDWFQLRYWRDHELGVSSLWAYAHHNYFHYNPRIGEVFLAIVDGSRAIHVIVTPLVQLALPPTVFVIAFGRRPRATLRDLELLLFIQVMIWLVIPIAGILYFYRPFTTNYLWGFTITLALFVPYRLALADAQRDGRWLAPVMLVLGWTAGMCNEHTGPTAMVALAGFVIAAWRRGRLRAWMVSGMVGLYVGYPMLFFAPGQSVRYGGMATRDTPTKLLAERGITGCAEIVFDFLRESWLGILLFVAALVAYQLRHRTWPRLPRVAATTAGVLAAASLAIVMTLFASPTTTDRVFFASGVLLVAALAIGAERLFAERDVRRIVVAACSALAAYHAVRFVATSVELAAENEQRLALLRTARPGSIAIVPSYERQARSRWSFGDDFAQYPWLRDYVAGTLFDLATADLDRPSRRRVPRYVAVPPLPAPFAVPTYRAWLLDPASRALLASRVAHEPRTIVVEDLAFADPWRRPVIAVESTREGFTFVDGRPHDDLRGHFIRVVRATIPAAVDTLFVTGCGLTWRLERFEILDDDRALLLPVDERMCRGPFAALACEPERCWVAGWY